MFFPVIRFIIFIIVFIMLIKKILNTESKTKVQNIEKSKEPSMTPEQIKQKEEEERSRLIEKTKEEIHLAAQAHVYVHGDKRMFSSDLMSFIHPSYADPKKVEILNRLADSLSEDEKIDHEAQWVWSTKYLLGFDNDPDKCEVAAHRAYNAARAGVVPALIYCLDDYKRRGLQDAALNCLERIVEKEKDTAHVITLEWQNEGFYLEKDSTSIAELVDYAQVGQVGEAHNRARWYLDLIGIEYK